MTTLQVIEEAIPAYLETICKCYEDRTNYYTIPEDRTEYVLNMYKEFQETLHYTVGKKFIKVVKGGIGASVHSFIVLEDNGKFKAGDILKPASWNTPAKNFARGNVLKPESYSNVSWTGAH